MDWKYHNGQHHDHYQMQLPIPVEQRRKSTAICGMPRSTFFVAIALIIVIMAAAVGGGVGGSMAVQSART